MKKSQILYDQHSLMVENQRGISSIQYNNITHIVFDIPYTIITTTESQKVILFIPFYEIYNNLPEFFFQCNKSTIINLKYVSSLTGSSQKGGILYLYNDLNIPVSVRKFSMLKKEIISLKKNLISQYV